MLWEGIAAEGSGNLQVAAEGAGNLEVAAEGAGNLEVAAELAGNLEVAAEGAGNLEVAAESAGNREVQAALELEPALGASNFELGAARSATLFPARGGTGAPPPPLPAPRR